MGQGPASRKENTGVSTGVVAQAPAVAFGFAGALAEQISCRYHDIRSHLARATLRATFGAGARARLMVKCGRVLRS